jgi:hypothetical protein
MTPEQITLSTQSAFKAFDNLKPGEGIDITKTKLYTHDKELMLDICKCAIDYARRFEEDKFVLSDDYKIFKRM